ncbi:baseplate J/gp47 family protein [Clostridium sp. C2-6-12]|uniref:baseplate J/gp47 family protein n=1 Tax=Clostridium sp. C2-6-12 TaxID=2698832 RepID=UPI0013705867|nr:baseplate J/gp47 family protein [Clostridium sp. C2-6-12]
MIKFVEIIPQKILDDMLNTVESYLGIKLSDGDERNIFLHSLSPIIIGLYNSINDTGNQNLLRNARDDKLNGLAEDVYSTKRLNDTKAFCKGIAKLSKIQNQDVPIKSGTKVTPDGNLNFLIRDNVVIKAGETQTEITLIAAETGAKYNGFLPKKINYIVDPIPYVSEIYNTEISASGSDVESDERYRQRARLYMESLSTAGPEGAYQYHALSADNSITSVKITSPSPGVVRIYALVDGGELPSKEILDKIYDACAAKDKRPLTDKVETAVPDVINYSIELTYYLDKNFFVKEGEWRKAIEGTNFDCSDGAIREFIKWQQRDIGKAISPDELKYFIQNAAAIDLEGTNISGVRRIELVSPIHQAIEENQVAKVSSIKIKYGGLE